MCPAQSPLKPAWDRVLQIGDASGIQSPLSFGGFGALTRHLPRLHSAISQALQVWSASSPNIERTCCLLFLVRYMDGAAPCVLR